MTRVEARDELLDAMRIVDGSRGDAQVWRQQWDRMVRVQKDYDGTISLEPLLMARPPGIDLTGAP